MPPRSSQHVGTSRARLSVQTSSSVEAATRRLLFPLRTTPSFPLPYQLCPAGVLNSSTYSGASESGEQREGPFSRRRLVRNSRPFSDRVSQTTKFVTGHVGGITERVKRVGTLLQLSPLNEIEVGRERRSTSSMRGKGTTRPDSISPPLPCSLRSFPKARRLPLMMCKRSLRSGPLRQGRDRTEEIKKQRKVFDPARLQPNWSSILIDSSRTSQEFQQASKTSHLFPFLALSSLFDLSLFKPPSLTPTSYPHLPAPDSRRSTMTSSPSPIALDFESFVFQRTWTPSSPCSPPPPPYQGQSYPQEKISTFIPSSSTYSSPPLSKPSSRRNLALLSFLAFLILAIFPLLSGGEWEWDSSALTRSQPTQPKVRFFPSPPALLPLFSLLSLSYPYKSTTAELTPKNSFSFFHETQTVPPRNLRRRPRLLPSFFLDLFFASEPRTRSCPATSLLLHVSLEITLPEVTSKVRWIE